MKHFKLNYLLAFILLIVIPVQAQIIIPETLQKLSSPDGSYEFTFYQKQIAKGEKQMYYVLSYKGKTVVQESELGVLIENQLFESALAVPNDTCKIWGENLNFLGVERTTVDDTWKPVYGEHASIRNNYNELTLKFKKGASETIELTGGYDKSKSYNMNVVVRVYNQGTAIRYFFPEATNGLFLHITGEQTQFAFPEGTMAYHESWAQGPYNMLPLKNWTDESERPLTLKLSNGITVALAEAEMVDYARMKFRLNDKKENTLQASIYSSVDAITPYSTPWRVIMVAEKAIELIANKDIILNLNPASKLTDVSWIKPGKAIRVAKVTQEDVKKTIDFAAERGLQYVHIDAGWYGPEMKMSSDARTVSETKDLNFPELTAYAATKGIGVFVYVNQRALVQQLDSILPLYKKWGLKGIKFGFVQIGNQRWTTWLHEAIKKCAEYGLMVDIHDEYRPTGFSRTYPNLMTQEGIRGNEEMPDATHNTTLPFTRYLAGPADYTICYYNTRVKNTHAHQLALSVVFYSPLQFLYWYDQPGAYQGEPEIEFFDKVKTVWDDTQTVDGKIGEYIVVARRSGADWFVGGITNAQARKITISTAFLEKGKKYVAKMYQDDDKILTRTKVSVTQKKIKGGDVLNFDLKASGGVAVYITPLTKK